MNQQRSRRFRSAQEAREKEEAHKEALAIWECKYYFSYSVHNKSSLTVAMGKTISDEERNKKTWDSNAITPGTPFMELLAISLRYWVARKMNTDPGWKTVCSYNFPYVYCSLMFVSDASYYLRCKRSRRRRTQDNGFHSEAAC